MFWSLILYTLLLLFAIKMILKLAPPAPARRLIAVQPNDRLRLEFSPTSLPSLEQTAFERRYAEVAREETELVNV